MIKGNKILDSKIDGAINIDKVKSLSVRVIEGDCVMGKLKVKYIFDEYMPQERFAILDICDTNKEYQETNIYVINDTNNFINGYKVVELSNHKFGYVKEETNELMPFYYDVALNFNNYGLAMVGKRNSVSWINKKFEFVSYYGEFFRIPLKLTKDNVFEFLNHEMVYCSFSRVCDFSNNEVPLSMVSASHISDTDFPPAKNTPFYSATYIDINGNIKKFTYYNGEFESYEDTAFSTGTSFNEFGYALASTMNMVGLLKRQVI